MTLESINWHFFHWTLNQMWDYYKPSPEEKIKQDAFELNFVKQQK